MDGWPIQHIGMRYHCFAQLVAKKRRVYGWMDEWTDGWMDLDGMFFAGAASEDGREGRSLVLRERRVGKFDSPVVFEPCAPFFLRLVFMFRLWD